MSKSARWKEDRNRERIYLKQLKQKHTETLPMAAGLNGTNSQGGTPVRFLQQTSGSRSPNRRKKKPTVSPQSGSDTKRQPVYTHFDVFRR